MADSYISNKTQLMWKSIAIGIIGCILICLLLILAAQCTDFAKVNDPYEYAHLGKSLWLGDGLRYTGVPDVVLPPGLPIALGAVNRIIDNLEWSGKLICMISFLLSLYVMYKISSYFLFEKKYFLLSVLLFGTNSNQLINATNGYSESFFTLVFMTAVWLTLFLRKQKRLFLWQSIIFGVLWATLYYIRPEGLIIGIILFCWLTMGILYNRILVWITPLLCVILIFPYLFFLKEYSGHWQLSGKTYLNLVMGELDSPYQRPYENENIDGRYTITRQTHANPLLSYGFGKYWDEAKYDLLKRIPYNLMKWGKIYWFSFSVAGIILFIWGFYRFERTNVFFLASMFLPAFLYLMFFMQPRSIAIYHWVWVIFMVSGLNNMKLYLESSFRWKHAGNLIQIFVLVISLYQSRSLAKIIYSQLT